MRILLGQINPTIGDLEGNTNKVLHGIAQAKEQRAEIILFPELCLTGYPPEDFLFLPHFIKAIDHYLEKIQAATSGLTAIVGTPRFSSKHAENLLHNSAAIFTDGKLIGFQDKTLLPTYDVFTERRYFEPAASNHVWLIGGRKVAITICEDIWQHSALLRYVRYARDPLMELHRQNPDLILNLSASPYSVSKLNNRYFVCSNAAASLNCPLLLCNQVGGNDGLIFDGRSVYVSSQGKVIQCARGFVEDTLLVDLSEAPEPCELEEDTVATLYQALVLGVHDYFMKQGFRKACFGLSGGIDSAVVACIAVEALGPENVLGVAMPSRFNPASSRWEAKQLASKLGIEYREISIEDPFQSYLHLLAPQFANLPQDCTEENLQARIRGMILMAISNKLGYIVLSTGNKSELAMGYATLYGDMCGGLGVISDVTKGQVYALANWINRKDEVIPWNTIKKPPSAELKPNQRDSDTLPDYAIIDHVLQAYMEEYLSPEQIASKFNYPLSLVNELINRIHLNEYKRRQSPPGLRVTEKAFSVGRRFPIVQGWTKNMKA